MASMRRALAFLLWWMYCTSLSVPILSSQLYAKASFTTRRALLVLSVMLILPYKYAAIPDPPTREAHQDQAPASLARCRRHTVYFLPKLMSKSEEGSCRGVISRSQWQLLSKAHKVILAAPSPMFPRRNRHPHPLIYVWGMEF